LIDTIGVVSRKRIAGAWEW